MKKALIVMCALCCILSGCGSAQSAESPAPETTEAVGESVAESAEEVVYEDINVYDFIIPASAKCELKNRSGNSTSVELHTEKDSNVIIQFFQEETLNNTWLEKDMREQAKVDILIFTNLEYDFDKAEEAPCDMEEEYVSGFNLYTIADYNDGCGMYACRQYNTSNYGIYFRTSAITNTTSDGRKIKITDYHDEIVDLLKSIKIT